MTITVKELRKTSTLYQNNVSNWTLYQNAYKGTKALVDSGIIKDDLDRDPQDVEYREKSAWGVELSQWIVDILADFVGASSFEEDFAAISKDWAFQEFQRDCNLYGTDWDVWWEDIRRAVYAVGMNGIIVDKGQGSGSESEMKESGVYPYISMYSPLAILDFEYQRDEKSNRPFLAYLKLKEADNVYKLWYPDRWEAYTVTEGQITDIQVGVNPLGEIPFVWYYNLKDVFNNMLGMSDIVDISRNDVSIIRLTADMSQVTNAAAFLMLATPESPTFEDTELTVGPNERIRFDGGEAGSKPFWLTPDVSGPINAILSIIDKQEFSAIRSKNLNAVFATMSADARSGDSIKQAFKFLEAMLNRKVANELEARRDVMRLWLKWREMDEMNTEISISHPRSFDVGSLIVTIADALTAKTIVRSSPTFLKEMDKMIVKNANPDLTTSIYNDIAEEIDKSSQVMPDEVGDFKPKE